MFSKIYLAKYLKYKNKYLKLKGGATIPSSLPGTQSWFYMPLILAPFRNIRVEFPDEINKNAQLACLGVGMGKIECDLSNIIEKIKAYYISKGINLDDYRNLSNLGAEYVFDGELHIPGRLQVKILDDVGIIMNVEMITPKIIDTNSGAVFTFETI